VVVAGGGGDGRGDGGGGEEFSIKRVLSCQICELHKDFVHKKQHKETLLYLNFFIFVIQHSVPIFYIHNRRWK